MSDPSRQRRSKQAATSADGDLQWRSPIRVYRSSHGSDWLILLFFAALPIGTSLDIAYEIGWSTQSGRLALLVGAVIAALWVTAYYAMKIAVHLRVSASGLALHQGPWRFEIAWREMARLSERARGAGTAYRWIIAEAADGRRLTIPSSSVSHYERFVSDINATFTDWRTHAEQTVRDGPRTDIPLAVMERPRAVVWLLAGGLSMAVVGAMLFAITRSWPWPGLTLVAAGAALTGVALRRRLAARTVLLDDRGISVRTRLGASALTWPAVTGVEQRRNRATDITGGAGKLAGKALHRALGLDCWTDGVPWPRPAATELVIRGAGRRLRVRLDRVDVPDELQAHLRMHLRRAAEIKAAAPPVRRVTQRLAAASRPTGSPDGAGPILTPRDTGSPSA